MCFKNFKPVFEYSPVIFSVTSPLKIKNNLEINLK